MTIEYLLMTLSASSLYHIHPCIKLLINQILLFIVSFERRNSQKFTLLF